MSKDYLKIKGAKEHNLKNISVDIPKNEFVVINGLLFIQLHWKDDPDTKSGLGKSVF